MIQWTSEPAVIIGPPRSGTTLLRRLLNGHPRICSPPEPYLLSSCARFMREERVARGVPIGPLTGLSYSGFGEDYVLDKLRRLVDEVYTDIRAAAGKARWVDKDGFSFFYVDEVERLLGDSCRYVCIVRHGLDVAVSLEELYQRLGAYPQECHAYVARHPVVLEAWAHLWSDVMQRVRGLVARRPDTTIVVTYEELTRDPARELARVAGFLGETYAPELIDAALADRGDLGLGDWKTYAKPTVEANNSERWRGLPQPTVAALARIVNPMLEAFGYDPLPTADPGARYYRRLTRAWRAGGGRAEGRVPAGAS